MADLLHWLPSDSLDGILLALGYPILVLAALEASRALSGRRTTIAADILRQTAYLLLPTGAIWLILREIAGLPAHDTMVRTAETAFALTGLYLLLGLVQGALVAVIDNRTNAPKLLLDALRIGLSLVWGALVVSAIWDVNLGSLFAAMGVGSIVLGFALQEFLGNLLSGLGLLSERKFGIGDWIVIDGAPARVVEMDWRTVTLTKEGNDRIVVANSTLAKGNLVIVAHGNDPASITIPLSFDSDIPPEKIRSAVLEAGSTMPDLAGANGVKCYVTDIASGLVNYDVIVPVTSPGIFAGPRDVFLSRFWYVAQRHGLRLDGAAAAADTPPDDADARLQLLTQAGAFHGDKDALARIARDCTFRQYRRSEVLLEAGAPATEAYLLLTGSLAVSVPSGEDEIRVELVEPGQLLVLSETLAGGAAPVRMTADQDADLLAIPAASVLEIMEASKTIARDVRALAEARRLAIQPLKRGLRAVG